MRIIDTICINVGAYLCHHILLSYYFVVCRVPLCSVSVYILHRLFISGNYEGVDLNDILKLGTEDGSGNYEGMDLKDALKPLKVVLNENYHSYIK